MSLLNVFRAKWKHPDAKIREAAVSSLDDQAVLASVAETDPSESVRLVALKRLTDQSLLGQIAKSETPGNAKAAEALTDPKILASVARTAKSVQVRRITVGKIDDRNVLKLVATQDIDAGVRHIARARNATREGLFDFLKAELSKLEVAERQAERVAGLCGNLDDVCGALIKDRRFRINGVLADEPLTPASAPHTAMVTATALSQTAESSIPWGRRSVELLAGSHAPFESVPAAAPLDTYYHIKISRLGQNEFDCSFEEKRSSS